MQYNGGDRPRGRSMSTWEDANRLAVLAAGANPQWVEQTDYSGNPDSAASGVYLEEALQTQVIVDLREELHRRTARVTIGTLDLTADYVIEINGNAVTYDAGVAGPADATEVLEGIAAAINADVTVGPLVTAEAVDTDEDAVIDTVVIRGDAEADYSIDFSTTGTAVLEVSADAKTASARIFQKAGGSGDRPDGWRLVRGANAIAIDRYGFAERLETGGIDRFYVELYDVDGGGDGASVTHTATVLIGPGVQ
jgi:hypothetical protein